MSDFSAYFSHKWSREFLSVNAMLWRSISPKCRLLLDQPEPTDEDERPYFIARLESLMRRADVMICCLPFQQCPDPSPKQHALDFRYFDCSPYILFELRLAERLDLPRFILHDRRSRFRPPATVDPRVRYVARDFAELTSILESGAQDRQLEELLEDWLRAVARNRVPGSWEVPSRSALLMSKHSGLDDKISLLRVAADANGFDPPEVLRAGSLDSELIQSIRALGLLIVDVSDPDVLPRMHIAHTLMVPTVRLAPGGVSELPEILRGHPAGYQLDLVPFGNDTADDMLAQRVGYRARAVVRAAQPVVGLERGLALLHQRTYLHPTHRIFISHNEKPGDRILVELLLTEFDKRGIRYWEYGIENHAGVNWPQRMDEGLKTATHIVALVAPRYEKSEGCMAEWNYAMEHTLPLLPFLTRGRSESVVTDRSFKVAHESRLSEYSINDQAKFIAERIADVLRGNELFANSPKKFERPP